MKEIQTNFPSRKSALPLGKILKSGKRIMDNKCYDALKYETNPNIEYRFVSVGSLKP